MVAIFEDSVAKLISFPDFYHKFIFEGRCMMVGRGLTVL